MNFKTLTLAVLLGLLISSSAFAQAPPRVPPYPTLAPLPTFVPMVPLVAGPPVLVAADGVFLGVLSANKYDPNSVSNPYGPYGSKYSPTSINNPYSVYGSPYSPLSATNPYATTPPIVLAPSPYLLTPRPR